MSAKKVRAIAYDGVGSPFTSSGCVSYGNRMQFRKNRTKEKMFVFRQRSPVLYFPFFFAALFFGAAFLATFVSQGMHGSSFSSKIR